MVFDGIIDGRKYTLTAVIRDDKGKELPSVTGFWLAWYAFHPDTEVFAESKQ